MEVVEVGLANAKDGDEIRDIVLNGDKMKVIERFSERYSNEGLTKFSNNNLFKM